MLRADYQRSVLPGRPPLAGADQGLDEGTVEHTKRFSVDHSDLLQGVEKFRSADRPKKRGEETLLTNQQQIRLAISVHACARHASAHIVHVCPCVRTRTVPRWCPPHLPGP